MIWPRFAGAVLTVALGTMGTSAAAAPDAGAKIFRDNCAVCHQMGGVGVPGQFPRLAGRVAGIASTPEGRQFLGRLALGGMSGAVKVDGQTVMGVMPGFGGMKDADLAAVLTYVAGLGAPAKPRLVAFTAAEIKAARALSKLPPSQMSAERRRLVASNVIP
jgi:mono/diheme cytochrome c family protein